MLGHGDAFASSDSLWLNRFRSRQRQRVCGWSHRAVESAKESTWSLRNFRLHSRAWRTSALRPYIKSLIEFSAVAPARERLGSSVGPFSLFPSLSHSGLPPPSCIYGCIVPTFWTSWIYFLSWSLSSPYASLRACYSSCRTVLFRAHRNVLFALFLSHKFIHNFIQNAI